MNQQFRNRPVRTILSIALAGCLALAARDSLQLPARVAMVS